MIWAIVGLSLGCTALLAGQIASVNRMIRDRATIKQLNETIDDYENAFEKLNEIKGEANEKKKTYRTGDAESDFNSTLELLRNLSGRRRESDNT